MKRVGMQHAHLVQRVWQLAVCWALLWLPACRSEQDGDTTALLAEKKALHCMLAEARHRTDSIWDTVSATLGRQLPADMKDTERRNMVAIRNADLIRMFEAYAELDTSLQQLITDAGLRDRSLSEEIRSAARKIEEVNARINQRLEQLEQSDDKKFRELRQAFREAENSPCR